MGGLNVMRWFRFHCEVRCDPKLRVLPYDERWVFVTLLCFAAEQEERGTIPPLSTFRLAAEVADGDEALLRRTLEHLAALDVVTLDEDGSVRFVHWHTRQYDHPSDLPEAVTERKRTQRKRQPETTATAEDDDVTTRHEVSRPCHDDVTRCHDDVTTLSRPCHEVSRHQNTDNRIQNTDNRLQTPEKENPYAYLAPHDADASAASARDGHVSVRKRSSPQQPAAAPPRADPLFEAVVEVCYDRPYQEVAPTLTKDERGRLNAAVKQLREVGATPEAVRDRARAYRQRWPDIALTPQALVKHWSALAPSPPPRPSFPRSIDDLPPDLREQLRKVREEVFGHAAP